MSGFAITSVIPGQPKYNIGDEMTAVVTGTFARDLELTGTLGGEFSVTGSLEIAAQVKLTDSDGTEWDLVSADGATTATFTTTATG
jgi:hypothetical protein